MKTVYLSLGSNQGRREEHLQQAVDALPAAGVFLKRCSPVYETEPQDVPNQPWFLNVVIEAETELLPMQLLAKTGGVEHALGRERRLAKGPRIIDIDILFFGRFVIESAKLVVPHPRLHQRRFVLQPLADLAPDLRHPVFLSSIRELLAKVEGQAVRAAPVSLRIPG